MNDIMASNLETCDTLPKIIKKIIGVTLNIEKISQSLCYIDTFLLISVHCFHSFSPPLIFFSILRHRISHSFILSSLTMKEHGPEKINEVIIKVTTTLVSIHLHCSFRNVLTNVVPNIPFIYSNFPNNYDGPYRRLNNFDLHSLTLFFRNVLMNVVITLFYTLL